MGQRLFVNHHQLRLILSPYLKEQGDLGVELVAAVGEGLRPDCLSAISIPR